MTKEGCGKVYDINVFPLNCGKGFLCPRCESKKYVKKITIYRNVNNTLLNLISYKDLCVNKKFWGLLIKKIGENSRFKSKHMAKVTIEI